jgi:hypothetical protein
MSLDRPSLDAAAARSVLTADQADALWRLLEIERRTT